MRYAKAIRWCALLAAACVGARDVGAQLAAFPGAEGAAQFATGGRGGDVYVVTNLNNTGAGSLRNGITSATGPRTIVFAVSGTIRLTSDLTINRSNITIAGQTAPGGGITLADRMVRVNNVSNVVLQHLRMRVGNTYANYEPDALWISGSNNVMIDHVSASWGVDEVLSATHGSSNVTVQWSMITEALHNAGHSKGNHGYGSLVNGGNFSFHHNLYAHNRSRNPRPQQSSVAGQLTQFDFVNNVIANPGDRFGYTGDETLNINWVGNYGISGQNTTAGALFHIPGGSSNVGFYAEGNVLDSNKNGILDGTPATGSRLVTNNHPLAGARFNLPQVQTTSAEQAYIQVLSRAGASYWRDPVDRRVIRSVMHQPMGTSLHIDSANDVGGWPTLPSLPAPQDSNGDGVPDAWAIAQGFAPSTPLNATFSSDGYTYLEKYIHSLTPYAYAPQGTAPVVITTAYGRGADAQVSENDGLSGGSTGPQLNARFDAAGARNEYIFLRFDLAGIQPGSVTAAQLDLTAFRQMSGSHQMRVYGLMHDADGWDWDESSISFDSAPALQFDGNSATRGLIMDDVVTLGALDASGLAEGAVASFANPNLAVFLNLAAHFEGDEQARLATIIIERTNASGTQTRFASKEASALESGVEGAVGAFAPRLLLEAVAESSLIFDPADFNGDGVVDAADLDHWTAGFGMASGATRADGDATGDGAVDGADFLVWQRHLGEGLSAAAASHGVPEPASATLALACIASAAASHRAGRQRRQETAAS